MERASGLKTEQPRGNSQVPMHAQTTHTPFILLDPPPGVGHGTKDACGHAASVCQYRMYLGSRARDTAATLKQQRMQPFLLLRHLLQLRRLRRLLILLPRRRRQLRLLLLHIVETTTRDSRRQLGVDSPTALTTTRRGATDGNPPLGTSTRDT